MTEIFEARAVPVFSNILCATREAALAVPRGDIVLRYCEECEFITNVAFDPGLLDYDASYENGLHFSPTFRNYAQDLAAGLIQRHNLYRKTIVEIGCGDGHFLELLCTRGHNTGVGFDPSVADTGKRRENGHIKIIPDYYSSKYAEYVGDFYCCRHTLEHLYEPKRLLQILRENLARQPNASVFFEVPNVAHTLNELSVWDIIYEHCSYFSTNSLTRLFSSCGFHVQAVYESYQDQFLCLEAVARPAEEAVLPSSHTTLDTKGFSAKCKNKVESWQAQAAQVEDNGKKAVVWGAGSKGVTFLNTVRLQQIQFAVDVNSRKHGKYVVGAGQQIVPPAFLTDYQPDYVIVMNSVYEPEIKQCLRELNIRCEAISC